MTGFAKTLRLLGGCWGSARWWGRGSTSSRRLTARWGGWGSTSTGGCWAWGLGTVGGRLTTRPTGWRGWRLHATTSRRGWRLHVTTGWRGWRLHATSSWLTRPAAGRLGLAQIVRRPSTKGIRVTSGGRLVGWAFCQGSCRLGVDARAQNREYRGRNYRIKKTFHEVSLI